MGRTAANRRKKINRKGDGKCRQCGSVEPRPDASGFAAWFSCKELTDEHYRIHRTDDKCPVFCCDACVDKWREQHELFCKSAVSYYGVMSGGNVKGIAVQDGKVVRDNHAVRIGPLSSEAIAEELNKLGSSDWELICCDNGLYIFMRLGRSDAAFSAQVSQPTAKELANE